MVEAKRGPETYILRMARSAKEHTYRLVHSDRIKLYYDSEGRQQVKEFLSRRISPPEEADALMESFDRRPLSSEQEERIKSQLQENGDLGVFRESE